MKRRVILCLNFSVITWNKLLGWFLMIKSFLTAILLLSSSFHCLKASADANPKKLVEDYYARFQQPGYFVTELMQRYTEDVRFIDPTFEIDVSGREEVAKLYADLGTGKTAYTNVAWIIRQIVAENDHVTIRGNWSGQFQDCPFDIEFMTLWKLRNGLIAEQTDFFAASTFDRQVGWQDGKTSCGSAD